MKSRGRDEILMGLSRIRRLRALGRVSGPDCDYIEERLMEVDARIVAMSEYDSEGEEV